MIVLKANSISVGTLHIALKYYSLQKLSDACFVSIYQQCIL